jgi:hypothetical protein
LIPCFNIYTSVKSPRCSKFIWLHVNFYQSHNTSSDLGTYALDVLSTHLGIQVTFLQKLSLALTSPYSSWDSSYHLLIHETLLSFHLFQSPWQ